MTQQPQVHPYDRYAPRSTSRFATICAAFRGVDSGVYRACLERARQDFQLSLGTGFAVLTQTGIRRLVVPAEPDRRMSLRAGDGFAVTSLTARESRIRFAFFRDIIGKSDDKLVLGGRNVGGAP